MQKVKAYSSKAVYLVAIILCILLCVFIFKMSGEKANVSAARSDGVSNKVTPILVKEFDTLNKKEQVRLLSRIEHVIRKIAHFCMYAALGTLFALVSLYHERTWRGHLLLPWLFATLYAASDEIHQLFIPGRGSLFSDVVLDSIGSLCGVLLALLAAAAVLKKNKNKKQC